jgi:hypothetical protein
MEAKGFRIVEWAAYYLVWERPAPPLARMYYDLDVIADPPSGWPASTATTRCCNGPSSKSPWAT